MLNRLFFSLDIVVVIVWTFFCSSGIQCQITSHYEHILSNQLDYLAIKHLPSVLHNDGLFLVLLYKCSLGTKRRIALDIRIEQNLYRTNFAVFRRHFFCYGSTQIRLRYIPIRLHRSLAYATDKQSNLQSWPIETGLLTLMMFKTEESTMNNVIKIIRHNVQFLPVEQRPTFYSYPWQPLRQRSLENTCPSESEVVRLVNYPLVITGSSYGKHLTLPPYHDYSLRLEQQLRANKPKFSILIWLYVDEYCPPKSNAYYCSILQRLNFNSTHYTGELFFTREGQIMVNMFGHLYDQIGTGARTFAAVPKKDWCRIVFVADEYRWNIYINCLRTWNEPIIASHVSPIYYYSYDLLGTLIIGGSELNPSFRGLVNRVDFYRRVALRYDQLPKKVDETLKLNFPLITEPTIDCSNAHRIFQQSFEQYQQYLERLRTRSTCSADIYRRKSPRTQCSPLRTWKKQLNSSMSSDIRYRIFRAFLRRQINSSVDVGRKLFELSTKLLEMNDPHSTCDRLVQWTHQSTCYEYPSSFSLLGTLYQFGLCNLTKSNRTALDYFFAGAFRNDRLSLLALAHRHFYGLNEVPLDYDAAYLYYRQMADTSRTEFYNPIAGEAAMDLIRLTDDKLMDELTFDKSDAFYWLKQQALRGVASAQQHLGSLLYSGSHGLTRNIQAAVEYFRLGAEQHDGWSHFGYGLALMKGEGIQQNMTAALEHLEKAVEHGYVGAQVALGFHAYENEKNYTKAAKYWQQCFDETHDPHCAHNLGVMWTAGHYPPTMIIDHSRAWQYYSFAAQRGQIDSKIVVAHYNARTAHPVVGRNPWLAALWARNTAEESSALGTIVRRGIEAFRDHRWETSFIYYLLAATAGAELGYFNAGYLCHEFHISYETTFDCIEQLLKISILTRPNELHLDPYALLTVAEYSQSITRNLTEAMNLYVDLYQHGDPRGLYSLAQLEEFEPNFTIPMKIWHRLGVVFTEESLSSRSRKIQRIYQHCRMLTNEKADESLIPCTLSYLRVTLKIFFEEQTKIFMTSLLIFISTILIVVRLW